jgi:hypothetical protein
MWQYDCSPVNGVDIKYINVRGSNTQLKPWPTKSELRYAYYGRNKARIFNGAIDSANLKKCTLNQLHLLAKWKRKM